MAGASKAERSFKETPTWAVAVVCFVLVLISIVIEHIIHFIGKWLKKKHMSSLHEALEKVKAELMLLGFISLLLTVGQGPISRMCIPENVADTWHPWRSGTSTYSLSRAKMRRWEAWENETRTAEYQFSHDPERFRFARDTTFGRRHFNIWSKSPILLWIACFFRQFAGSVKKVDYLTLRHGFIMSSNLVFRGSIPTFQHSCVDKVKLMICSGLLQIILLVSTKLQVIITMMGLRIQDRGNVVRGDLTVEPADDLFWFDRPQFILSLIHFVLFQNAFQLAFFAWTWYEFGLRSCFHEHVEDVTIRISMGIIVQFICSYVTLPLYALVTQMGSSMRPTVFNERVAAALKRWHHTARKHIKENRHSKDVTPNSSRPSTPMHGFSPVHLLSNHRARHDFAPASPRSTVWDSKHWENEESPSPPQRASTELQEQTQEMELANISLPISQIDHARNEIDDIGPTDQYRINIGSSSNKEFSFQKRLRE
ncbi:hypothetical protein Syun_016084 [Stephania yunnanensis]|uniref:MLO-like protein n=1 Tax=Stephania yunnanensis TaxID=152371 RepID=A0AAP0J456_9MAGN